MDKGIEINGLKGKRRGRKTKLGRGFNTAVLSVDIEEMPTLSYRFGKM